MTQNQARRITRGLTAAEEDRLRRHREQVAAELPDLVIRDRMRRQAREEPTLSGELRRAIHASELSLRSLAEQARISPLLLDQFLTGEQAIGSDALDRLANVLGYRLQRVS
jgi:hypothetical protein